MGRLVALGYKAVSRLGGTMLYCKPDFDASSGSLFVRGSDLAGGIAPSSSGFLDLGLSKWSVQSCFFVSYLMFGEAK